jgi:hypothetical protein
MSAARRCRPLPPAADDIIPWVLVFGDTGSESGLFFQAFAFHSDLLLSHFRDGRRCFSNLRVLRVLRIYVRIANHPPPPNCDRSLLVGGLSAFFLDK